MSLIATGLLALAPAMCGSLQAYIAVSPPSVVRVVPVIKDDSSDARNAAAAATSDTCPIRCSMRGLVISSHSSSRLLPTFAACASDASVNIGPGQTAFTLHVYIPILAPCAAWQNNLFYLILECLVKSASCYLVRHQSAKDASLTRETIFELALLTMDTSSEWHTAAVASKECKAPDAKLPQVKGTAACDLQNSAFGCAIGHK